MGLFDFIYDFFNRWGVILVTIFTFIIMLSTCGTKSKINFLNAKVDTLSNNVYKLKKENIVLKRKLKNKKKYDSVLLDKKLSNKNYKLLFYEKKLDQNKITLPEVKKIIIDSVD